MDALLMPYAVIYLHMLSYLCGIAGAMDPDTYQAVKNLLNADDEEEILHCSYKAIYIYVYV